MAKKKSKNMQIISKIGKKSIFFIVLCLIFGLAVGVGTVFVLTKDDVFKLNGETEIVLNVGDSYTEQYATAIAFGKDISSDIIIEGEVDTSKKGEYILTYTVNNFRFKNYTLYRKITVGEE